MAGLLFEYLPGYLHVAFRQRLSDIDMELRFSGDVQVTTPCDEDFKKGTPEIEYREDAVLLCHVSNVFCAFPDLIAWLESIACGVQECAFDWDAEGPDGRLHWCRRIRGTGFVTARWWGRDTKAEHRVMVETHQVVEAFYSAFRNMVESSDYDPIQYEKLPAGEVFALVLEDASLDNLAETLANSSREDARRLIEVMTEFAFRRSVEKGAPKKQALSRFIDQASSVELAEEDQSQWTPASWDGWPTEERKRNVVEVVFSGNAFHQFGSRLHGLRSERVEAWLSAPQP